MSNAATFLAARRFRHAKQGDATVKGNRPAWTAVGAGTRVEAYTYRTISHSGLVRSDSGFTQAIANRKACLSFCSDRAEHTATARHQGQSGPLGEKDAILRMQI